MFSLFHMFFLKHNFSSPTANPLKLLPIVMNSRRKSLSQNLGNLYGEDGKIYSKRYQKQLCKKNVIYNQVLFLRRCRDNEIVPKGLMPTTGLKSSKEKRIMLKAGLSPVRASINDHKIKLQETERQLEKAYKWLKITSMMRNFKL